MSVEELKKIFKGEILSDSTTLDRFSRDASLLEIRPQVVVFPKDARDIKNLVQFTAHRKKQDENISLTPRLAGTDMSGATLSESIVVEMTKYFNHIKTIGKDFAVTEPGVFYRDFEKETLKRDLLLPTYPASRDLCTVGGMIANNSGGEKTLIYGKTEDYAREIKMVLRDGNEYVFKPLTFAELARKKKQKNLEGEIYRKTHALVEKNYELLRAAKPKVSKNSAGYYLWNVLDKEDGIFDLTKIITGSQGTLGIITEATLKLIRPTHHSRLLVIYLKDMKMVARAALAVLKHKPESFESFDDHTFRVALRLLPGIIKKLKGNSILLGLSFLPDFWTILTSGMPKMILLAEFTAERGEEAYAKARAAQKTLAELKFKTKVTKSAREGEKYWVIRRESFNLLRHHVRGKRTAPFIDDVIVRPDDLPEFLPRLYDILNKYDIIYTVAGHVGDGNFHVIPLMDFHKSESKQIMAELSKKVYALVAQFHGSITAEHNDGLIRTPFLEMMYGKKICALFKELKNIFDPDGIFNPGKKVGADMQYMLDHIKIESA